MKINRTKIALKIVRLIKKLEPADWSRVKTAVDDMYYALWLLKPEETQPGDDIEEIEEEMEEEK